MQLSAFVNFTLLLGEDVKHSSYHQHQRHPPFAFWCSSSDPTSSRVAYIQAGMLFATFSKDFYLAQVHSPRHFKDPARLFGQWYLEMFTRTPCAQPMTILALIIGYRPAEKSRAASTSSVDRNSSLFGVSDSRPVHSPLGGSFSVATAARDQRRSQHAERRPYCFFPSRLASAADAFRPFSTDPPARDEPETPSTQP
ncbi:hypothetical protein A4X03_0g8158 [Tilletia caries]|nr:hypothetical protein A4X03_0g8158 [Tilletia caries]